MATFAELLSTTTDNTDITNIVESEGPSSLSSLHTEGDQEETRETLIENIGNIAKMLGISRAFIGATLICSIGMTIASEHGQGSITSVIKNLQLRTGNVASIVPEIREGDFENDQGVANIVDSIQSMFDEQIRYVNLVGSEGTHSVYIDVSSKSELPKTDIIIPDNQGNETTIEWVEHVLENREIDLDSALAYNLFQVAYAFFTSIVMATSLAVVAGAFDGIQELTRDTVRRRRSTNNNIMREHQTDISSTEDLAITDPIENVRRKYPEFIETIDTKVAKGDDAPLIENYILDEYEKQAKLEEA